MATYTKEEAARELERYRQRQQEIADATKAAAKEKYQRTVASAEETAAEKTAAAIETARNRYDAARIQQLADTYRLAEQIANRGTTRGGQAAAVKRAVARGEAVARQSAAAGQREALSQVAKALTTAKETAESTYRQKTADANRKLSQNVENKRLSLERNIKEETV